MKYTSALLALAAASSALAQQTGNVTEYATGLVAALNSAGLTSLAEAAQGASEQLIPALQNGNKTVLAPTNEAFAAIASANLSPEILVATLSYHVINSTVNVGNISSSGSTIASSSLVGEEYVQLPNNRSQVVVFRKYGNDTAYVAEAARNVSFVNATDGPQYQNLRVQPITQVLSIPGNLTTVATELGASSLAEALTQANLLETLQNSRNGLTIFAPNNAAFEAAAETIAQATPEQVANVLTTHVINGTVAYSTVLTAPNAPKSLIAASGNNLTFGMQDGGLTVSSGNATARIIRTDVLASNAVVHVIDAVLANPASNPAAASSAFAGATSSAATQPAPAPTSTGSGSGSGGANAGFKLDAGFAAVAGLTVAGVAALFA